MFGKGLRGLLCAAAVLYAFSGHAAAEEPGVTADSITIGAFGPITGPAAYIGLAGRDGANLAIKEINAAGGINGRKLSMVFEDDGHSPTKALAAVKKLIDQDHVFMIFCVAGSNGTLGTIDFVRENGRVMYVSFASAPGVTWPFARNLFRGGTTEVPRYGELYAEYLHDYLKATKIAILSGREEYPKNEGDALTAQLKNWYQTAPVKRAEFNIGDKDFTPQLLEIQGANPQVIAIFGNPAEAAIAMRQAKELGMNQSFFVGSNMVDQGLLSAAKQSAEGTSGFALIPLLPTSTNPEMKSWLAKWKQEYPNLPAGRPNTFDLLVLCRHLCVGRCDQARRQRSDHRQVDRRARGDQRLPRRRDRDAAHLHQQASHRQSALAGHAGEERRMGAGRLGRQARERHPQALPVRRWQRGPQP